MLPPDLQKIVCFFKILNGLSLRDTGTDNVTPIHVIVVCNLTTAFISCAYLPRIGSRQGKTSAFQVKIPRLLHLRISKHVGCRCLSQKPAVT